VTVLREGGPVLPCANTSSGSSTRSTTMLAAVRSLSMVESLRWCLAMPRRASSLPAAFLAVVAKGPVKRVALSDAHPSLVRVLGCRLRRVLDEIHVMDTGLKQSGHVAGQGAWSASVQRYHRDPIRLCEL